jgi:hypothetical protein
MDYDDEDKGTKQTIHSFRGTFRSLIEAHSSEHKASFEVKESILDHHSGSLVERAYTQSKLYRSGKRTAGVVGNFFGKFKCVEYVETRSIKQMFIIQPNHKYQTKSTMFFFICSGKTI